MAEIEYIGRPYTVVTRILTELGLDFSVERTFSTSKRFSTDDQCLYVIRQRMCDNGTLLLTVAAKMGKEVS
jgi:hypothetical protein